MWGHGHHESNSDNGGSRTHKNSEEVRHGFVESSSDSESLLSPPSGQFPTQIWEGHEQSFAGSPGMRQIHKSRNTVGAW